MAQNSNEGDTLGTGCWAAAGVLACEEGSSRKQASFEEINRLLSNHHANFLCDLEQYLARCDASAMAAGLQPVAAEKEGADRFSVSSRTCAQRHTASRSTKAIRNQEVQTIDFGVKAIGFRKATSKTPSLHHSKTPSLNHKSSTFSQEMSTQRCQTLALIASSNGHAPERAHTKNVGDIIRSAPFGTFQCILVITYALFFGVEVEYMARTLQEDRPTFIKAAAFGFTVVFTVELLVRVIGVGIKGFFLSESYGWNMLDTIIVFVSIFETVLEFGGHSDSIGGLNIIPVLRMSRMVRLLRIVRLVRSLRSLRILVQLVIGSLQSLTWTLCFIMMILYITSLVIVEAVTEQRLELRGTGGSVGMLHYFNSLPDSIFCLFMCITGGVSWIEVAQPLGDRHPVTFTVFLAFIAFNFFAVLNVVTGIVCQSASECARIDDDLVVKEQMNRKGKYVARLEHLFKALDTHQDGHITLEELEAHMHMEWFHAYFEAIDITVDEAFNLFKLLDVENSGVLDLDHFVTGCLRLKGSARGTELAMNTMECKWTLRNLTKSVEHIRKRIENIDKFLEKDMASEVVSLDSSQEFEM